MAEEPRKTVYPVRNPESADTFDSVDGAGLLAAASPETAGPFVPRAVPQEPRVIPRAEHPISRRDIAREALSVLQRLRSTGYRAYLVGGAVRDLYLGRPPKDYDVATDARPSRLKKLFRNCRIIGRRFRIAHVFFPSGQIVEVATFRKNSTDVVRSDSGVILQDNVYGSPGEDALRRDLTINGLFYDLESFSVIDYVDGVQDLQNGVIRTINDPNLSFREDPARMVRALRHAARTGFRIEEATLEAVHANCQEIVQTNPSRLLEELYKDLRSGASLPFFQSLVESGLFECILPELATQLIQTTDGHPLWRRLEALDARTRAGTGFTNPVLLSLFLYTLLFPDPAYWEVSQPGPPDVWRYLAQGFHRLPRTIRVSRRETERVAQILISLRKLFVCLERGKLTRSLRHKPYVSEALDVFGIDLELSGQAQEQVEEWKRDIMALQRDHAAGGGEADGGQEESRDQGSGRRKRRRRRRPK